jgi:hypothetical protein
VLILPKLLGAFRPLKPEVFGPGKKRSGPARCGLGGRKAPSSLGKISTAEVLRLRATSAMSRDKSVRRSAQDDDFVGVLTKHPKQVNKLALMGLRPIVFGPGTLWRGAPLLFLPSLL